LSKVYLGRETLNALCIAVLSNINAVLLHKHFCCSIGIDLKVSLDNYSMYVFQSFVQLLDQIKIHL